MTNMVGIAISFSFAATSLSRAKKIEATMKATEIPPRNQIPRILKMGLILFSSDRRGLARPVSDVVQHRLVLLVVFGKRSASG